MTFQRSYLPIQEQIVATSLLKLLIIFYTILPRRKYAVTVQYTDREETQREERKVLLLDVCPMAHRSSVPCAFVLPTLRESFEKPSQRHRIVVYMLFWKQSPTRTIPSEFTLCRCEGFLTDRSEKHACAPSLTDSGMRNRQRSIRGRFFAKYRGIAKQITSVRCL